MKRVTLVLVLGAWFFGVEGGTIGPFDNEQKCDEIRAQYASLAKTRWPVLTKCWYFGGVLHEPKPFSR